MQILLVDDDHILAKSTAKLIELLGGHQVTVTIEPAEIFRLCQTGLIDVVLMDVNLAGVEWGEQKISGADISRLLKTQAQTAAIPVILITAYAILSERQHLMEISLADEFCAKPITDYQALLTRIDQLCQKQ